MGSSVAVAFKKHLGNSLPCNDNLCTKLIGNEN